MSIELWKLQEELEEKTGDNAKLKAEKEVAEHKALGYQRELGLAKMEAKAQLHMVKKCKETLTAANQ